MKNLTSLLLAIITLGLTQCAQSNWPQYLGPNRNSSIDKAIISGTWPEKGPAKVWEFALGKGYGGASVYAGEVFLLDRVDSTKDVLRCLDLNTGKELWKFEYDAPGKHSFPGSRAVPTVDKKYVWMVGPHGHFHCIEKKTHKVVWKTNIVDDFEITPAWWGLAQSPIIYKDLVIVSAMGEKAGVVAFEKLTGKVKWKSRKLSGRTFYSSATLATYGGVDQVIAISPYHKEDSTKTQEIVAFDVNTGEELWSYKGLRTFGNITPATIVDKNRLLVTDCSYNGNYKPVTIMLNIEKTDGAFKVDTLFFTLDAGCKMHPVVIHEGHIYLNNSGKNGQMACLNMKGENLWKDNDSVPKFEMGGYILLGDLILNQNGKNGDIYLIEPSPEGYKELGKASYFTSKKSQAWAPLAFSKGKLLIRDTEKIVCLDLMKP